MVCFLLLQCVLELIILNSIIPQCMQTSLGGDQPFKVSLSHTNMYLCRLSHLEISPWQVRIFAPLVSQSNLYYRQEWISRPCRKSRHGSKQTFTIAFPLTSYPRLKTSHTHLEQTSPASLSHLNPNSRPYTQGMSKASFGNESS